MTYRYKLMINQSNVLIDYNSHYIFYHNHHNKNYLFVLEQLKMKSPSQLKYIRKTNITNHDNEYNFITSDIHIEVDFELLGVNQYSVFFDLYKHVQNNLLFNKTVFYIVCLHFNDVHNELLHVFFTFMNNSRIRMIILSNKISFMPSNLLKHMKIQKHKGVQLSNYNKTYESRIDIICDFIQNKNSLTILQWREKLYELLIMNDNIHDCFSYLIGKLIQDEYIQSDEIDNVLKTYNKNIHKYNNNYRSIYHLEHFIMYLINLKT